MANENTESTRTTIAGLLAVSKYSTASPEELCEILEPLYEKLFNQKHASALAVAEEYRAAYRAQGLPEGVSVGDFVLHHRANAGVAAAMDTLATVMKTPITNVPKQD